MRSDDSGQFNNDASFIVWKDKFISGTFALESSNYRGYYIRHQNNVIRLDKYDDSTDFKESASWNFIKSTEVIEPEKLLLLPIWRLKHSTSGDIILTTSDERKASLLT